MELAPYRTRTLPGVRTTELFHATPETGTFSLHGHLARFHDTVFACWDSQAQDENAPGQHIELARIPLVGDAL